MRHSLSQIRRLEKSASRCSRLSKWVRGSVDRTLQPSSKRLGPLVQRYWFRHPLQYGLLQELRSFLGRIEMICDTRTYRGGFDFGPAFERLCDGHLVPCKETQTRILDTRKLREKWPWVSVIDVQVFLAGWDMRADTVLDIVRTELQSVCSPLKLSETELVHKLR
jgi:hypothetical protein